MSNLDTGCGSKLHSVQSDLMGLKGCVDSLNDLVYSSVMQSSTCAPGGSATAVVKTVASRVVFPSTLKGFDPALFSRRSFAEHRSTRIAS